MKLNGPIGHIGSSAPLHAQQRRAGELSQPATKPSFQHMLERELKRSEPVHFSHHAKVRMQERGLELTSELMGKVQQAVAQAAGKGSKQALVVVDNAAFIVNVKARTVITALDEASQRDHVFTEIDSAILMK
ncbi:TIGR02530 family flagellar biosynthesis protein [Paenibacillus sp. 481]|uniref:TIGR02530 family flagellar biosynthesis protein n=1 Tax=Paenibacillus sp. 481 TaxID=2835869 RepID=UPI001E41A960|nr:TIGR02530 family flagellar biosynthesis protein [Paenibacillus sp. 481]UHA73932.1 flagellar operon protein [Paenibacillus sp. 481]